MQACTSQARLRIWLLGFATVVSHGGALARGIDLEAPLRENYTDRGRVSEKTAQLPSFSEPVKYLTAGPASARRYAVVIHGGVFSANTWRWVGTLDALAEAGIAVVAPDLNKYSGQFASPELRGKLIRELLSAMGWAPRPKSVLLVAASMGGTVALPFLLDKSQARLVSGYVSVSALLELGTAAATATSSIPALLVWGEDDHPNSSKARAHEAMFPKHQKVVIPNAPHPAYLKEPELFNELLVRFAKGKTGALPSGKVDALHLSADWGGGGGGEVEL